jgi:flagellar protein FliO/FliZ
MNLVLSNPKNKLWLAAFTLVLLLGAAAASAGPVSPSALARGALGLTAMGGLGLWFVKAKGQASQSFKSAPRLQVVQRIGLSPKNQVALVEVDGRPYLIVHGEGFAKIQPARQPKLVSTAFSKGIS